MPPGVGVQGTSNEVTWLCCFSANATNGRTFTAGHIKDKVFTGDGVLTLDGVSGVTCARRCLQEPGCGFFFYNSAARACALAPSGTTKTLTDAPGYQLFANSEGPTGASSNARRFCSGGTDTARGCWQSDGGAEASSVSIGPAGMWVIGITPDTDKGHGFDVWYKTGTYQHPEAIGDDWIEFNNTIFAQWDVGPDTVWAVNTPGALYFRSGITDASPIGSSWVRRGDGIRWVSVSPQGSVWAVNASGHLIHGPNAADGALPVAQWDVVEAVAGLARVDAGRAGVWALDDAQRLHYRLGTYGQDGVSSTGWQQVEGAFTSVSSGRDLVVAVDTAGNVWLKTCMDADTPASMGWAWLSGGMLQAEIYQSGDVAAMWAVDSLHYLYFFLL